MCAAGIVLFIVGVWAARTDIAHARALDKIVALANLSFAIPLAVFGALHLADVSFVLGAVPSYMPWKYFWAYFVGVALIAASLSMATKIQIRWAGLLFGAMMFLFVALSDTPGALADPGDRFGWTFVLRELSFGCGGLALAVPTLSGRFRIALYTLARTALAVTSIFYGVMHFLHPFACPGVPLQKLMPAWIPAQLLIGYLTGAILVAAGAAMLINRKTRIAAALLGGWIVLLVLVVYGPILVSALLDPSAAVQIEGINYFADTLLFAGAILALAGATPQLD